MVRRKVPIAEAAFRFLEQRGCQPVEVPVLQPADPFLDTAGEDLRRRIFLTQSETGESLCLRPEFTIPVCLDHIRTRADTPCRYSYVGEVFRQRREGGNGFLQAGIEDLGDSDLAVADARSIDDALELLKYLLPDRNLSVVIGDQAVFDAVLNALDLPRGWQQRLVRAFGDSQQLDSVLADLASPDGSEGLCKEVARLVHQKDQPALSLYIERSMELAGISPYAGRTPVEIADRLLEKRVLVEVEFSGRTLAALRQFLGMRFTLDGAVDALFRYARVHELALDKALNGFQERLNALRSAGTDISKITYDCGFGRKLDYYTGLVFEISSEEQRPLAGGGRYDRLLTMLGSSKSTTGVGFSVWLDRVEELAGGN